MGSYLKLEVGTSVAFTCEILFEYGMQQVNGFLPFNNGVPYGEVKSISTLLKYCNIQF